MTDQEHEEALKLFREMAAMLSRQPEEIAGEALAMTAAAFVAAVGDDQAGTAEAFGVLAGRIMARAMENLDGDTEELTPEDLLDTVGEGRPN